MPYLAYLGVSRAGLHREAVCAVAGLCVPAPVRRIRVVAREYGGPYAFLEAAVDGLG